MAVDVSPFEESDFAIRDDLPVEYLSPSSISTLMRCPEQFRHQYVLRRPKPPGAWGVTGGAFHVYREKTLEAKLRGDDVTLEQAKAFFREGWLARIGEPNIRWGDDTPQSSYQQGMRMVEAYHGRLHPRVHPVAVERGVRGFLPGVPIAIYLRLDVLEADGYVLDTKTGKQGAKSPKPEWLVQALVTLALMPDVRGFRWHTMGAGKNISTFYPPREPALEIQSRSSRRETGERYARQAYDLLLWLVRKYGREQVWPGTGVAAGSCKFCEFRNRCVHVP